MSDSPVIQADNAWIMTKTYWIMCDILMGSGINYDTTYLISHRSAFYDNSDVLGFTFNKYESPIHKKKNLKHKSTFENILES